MEFKRSGDLVEIGDSIRVEAGPRLVTKTADAELIARMSEQSSPAAVNSPDEGRPHRVLLDAKGNVVEEGAEIQVYDRDGFREGADGGKVYYLYRLREREEDEPEGHNDTHVWAEEGVYPTEEEAISAGLALATGG